MLLRDEVDGAATGGGEEGVGVVALLQLQQDAGVLRHDGGGEGADRDQPAALMLAGGGHHDEG